MWWPRRARPVRAVPRNRTVRVHRAAGAGNQRHAVPLVVSPESIGCRIDWNSIEWRERAPGHDPRERGEPDPRSNRHTLLLVRRETRRVAAIDSHRILARHARCAL